MIPFHPTAAAPAPPMLDDPARLDALRDVGLIDAGSDATLERLARVTAELLDVPVSLVSLLEADREFFAAAHGAGGPWLEQRVAPLSHSVCKHVVTREAPLVVADGRVSSLASCRRAARDLHLRAYAGVPLTLHDGHTLGALCAIDTIPREWSEHDLHTLRDVAEIAVDVLEARRASFARDLHDRLTGLPVRSLFGEFVTRALARPGARTAVIAIGLDGFRMINDAFGHEAGDRALVAVAQRLSDDLDGCDAVCRVAGDEFLVLCDPPAGDPDAVEVAERLRVQATGAPVRLGEQAVNLDATVGVAVAGTQVAADDMIDAALDALARTKAGTSSTSPGAPDPQRRRRAADRLRLHSAIAGAHERGELHLVYQPLIDVRSGRLSSLEALVRWQHPELGPIAPGEFIPSAERSGAIIAIGEWVIAQAAFDVARWRALAPGLSVAVNIAPIQLRTPDLPAAVATALTRHELPAGALTLEITERVLLDDAPAYARAMQELRELGTHIALDDFGTGYSALSYLTRFPLDSIKIDRGFIATLDGDPRTDAVIDGIVAIAARLGLRTVAEGIETAGQLEHITRLGCDLAQGFHLARPRTAAQLEPLLREQPIAN